MPFGGTGEGAMGALVPFPTVQAQGGPVGARPPSDTPAKVIILPVVQYVRPPAPTAVSAAGEKR